MKKSVFLCFLFLLFLSQYEYHDLSVYQSSTKTVEVKGEVAHDQVIEVLKDATIEDILTDVVLLDSADLSSLNLTMNPQNHAVIVIPAKTEQKKVSINSGSLEELDSLPGIGPVVAQRIIDYRQEHPFQTLIELKEVKGIGDALFEKMKDAITL